MTRDKLQLRFPPKYHNDPGQFRLRVDKLHFYFMGKGSTRCVAGMISLMAGQLVVDTKKDMPEYDHANGGPTKNFETFKQLVASLREIHCIRILGDAKGIAVRLAVEQNIASRAQPMSVTQLAIQMRREGFATAE